MSYIYSTSGAQIKFTGTTVYKTGDDVDTRERILNQSRWLRNHQISAFPKVYGVWDKGYSMEKLEIIDWYRVDANNEWGDILQRIILQLKTIWSYEKDYSSPIHNFMQFLNSRIDKYAPELFLPMDRWADDLMHEPELTSCLTHGDTTLDNTCLRKSTGEIVFIDPNPRPEIPSLLGLDVAMLIQSTLGYEHLKYGHPIPKWTLKDIKDNLSLSDADWFATMFFTAAKFIRILHYEDHLRPVFLEIAKNIINQEGYL